jgi:hypothetical protein
VTNSNPAASASGLTGHNVRYVLLFNISNSRAHFSAGLRSARLTNTDLKRTHGHDAVGAGCGAFYEEKGDRGETLEIAYATEWRQKPAALSAHFAFVTRLIGTF